LLGLRRRQAIEKIQAEHRLGPTQLELSVVPETAHANQEEDYQFH
jgi:hypothetical protein